MEENVERVLAGIREVGVDPADIRILIASHAHYDHVGGLAGLLDVTGANLVLSERDAVPVRRGDGGFGVSIPSAEADRILGHLDEVSVGDRTLTAHLTPGHTDGCTSWSGEVEIAGEKAGFVLVCSLSVLEDYALVGEETYPGIARDYCTSVAHLRTLEPDIFLAPHGGFFGMRDKIRALEAGDPRAFIDPERYVEYLDGAEAAIERALADQGHEGGCESLRRPR